MPTDNTKLRGKRRRLHEPWPLGAFPDETILNIGKQLVHRMAIGHSDIAGDDFATIYANAIGGRHRKSPLGIADVVMNGNAWSVKTIKANKPFTETKVRLISGRNSPDYSQGIKNPHVDPKATGKAVLAIWNARVNELLGEYGELRIVVLIRNMFSKEYVLFEKQATKYAVDDYNWVFNKSNNLVGHDKAIDEHRFTWQPHGSQFTVIRPVPGSAIKFKINGTPAVIEVDHILGLVKFKDEWIQILN